MVSDEAIFNVFVIEGEHLKSESFLNSLNLQKSANHLCFALKMRPPAVLLADGLEIGHEVMVLGNYKDSEDFLNKHGTVKIRHTLKKDKMIEVFVHEMFHRVQFIEPRLMKEAVSKGSFEPACNAFVSKVMRKVGLNV